MNIEYEPIIGLEVHVQLLTESKMFCGCSTKFGAEPNTQTCPICLGMPGVLPVTNKKAVTYAVKMALAVHCTVNEKSIFARKHYFYPDLPKGYQISQYEEPLSEHGWIEIESEGAKRKRICIRRIHLEEDAGKSVHAEEYVRKDESLVDLNRCGVPLIEIVSEPDIQSPKEAYLYLTQIRRIVRWLGICDGNMEEGSLRCDANISLRPVGSNKLGVKTELKNMNSFRAVEKALAFELERQRNILRTGGKITQETLLWDETHDMAISMREKEEAHDYRYFPEPDLIPLVIEKTWMETIRKSIPELPEDRKNRWIQEYSLPHYDASVLSEDKSIADYFEAVVKEGVDPKQASNWVMGEVLRILNEEKIDLSVLKVQPLNLAMIIGMIRDRTISSSAGKKLFQESARSGMDPREVVSQLGLKQVSDETELKQIVDEIISGHPDAVEKYIQGHEKLFGFLIGQIMKATKGKANPQIVGQLLRERLGTVKND